ncbi:MAG: hypothetical protein AAGF11_16330 [Myxococcota bacterium]
MTLGLGALLLLGTACPSDDVPAVETDASSSSGSTTTGPDTLPPPTTGMDTTEGATETVDTTEGATETVDTTEGTTESDLCGNGMLDDDEVCDGDDLDGQDCVSQGFMGGGQLACQDDCSDFDTSACMEELSTCCQLNKGPGCDNMVCQDAVCALDPFCCSMQWDQLCADAAGVERPCAPLNCPPPPCGNGVLEEEEGEACDGMELGGEDCVSQGFPMGGMLGCTDECTFDYSACMGSDCCVSNGSPGCDDMACEMAVCALDSFCCDMTWDGICAYLAGEEAACAPLMCPSCGDGQIIGIETCDGMELGGQDCVGLGYGSGDLGCADDCLDFDVTECVLGMDYTCAEAMGAVPVNMGDTLAEDDDLAEGCGDGGGPETVIEFTATLDGTYSFDAVGSDYDTVLAAFFDCGGIQITCSDDAIPGTDCGGVPCSEIFVDMAAGETVLISIAGYSGATGNWVVNVGEPGCGNGVIEMMEVCDGIALAGETCLSQGAGVGPLGCAPDCSAYDTSMCMPGVGDCCADNGMASPGCDDAACTLAVCTADAFCCDNTWDQTCADLAILEPMCMGVGGTCP